MRTLLTLLAALVLATAAGPASAAEPRASLPDIEDEVLCPTCGIPLQVAESPQAEAQRDFIRELIAEGRTKQEIKDALVAQYGKRVLALEDDDSFNVAVVLIPIALLLAAAGVIAFVVPRWRQRTRPAPAARAGPALDPADMRRLEADLSSYDP